MKSSKPKYLRPELWCDGTLQFWNDGLHNKEMYEPFLDLMRDRAKIIKPGASQI